MNKILKKFFSVYRYELLLVHSIVTAVEAVISAFLLIKFDPNFHEQSMMSTIKLFSVLISISAVITCIVIWVFRERIEKLLETIRAISEGNLVISVNMDDDESYDETYKTLNNVVEELKNSKDEIDSFNNEILHDFKTPIAAIHGFAEHLIKTGEGIESPERMKCLKIIADESIKLSELAQKKLLLAKVRACRIITNKTSYNLSEQIKNCSILFLPQIEEKNIDLLLDVDGLSYVGNEELMENIWINLLSNAIKFTPENGEISIKGFADARGITLQFSDSGIGISQENQKYIFDQYYQCHQGRQKEGCGIGLSIVKRIVELCSGSIVVKSEENEGSTFTVFLPK